MLELIGGCFIGVFFLAIVKAYFLDDKNRKDDDNEDDSE